MSSPSFSPRLPQPRQSPIASSCSHVGPPPRSSCSPAAHPPARRHRAPPARPPPRSSCCCTRPARRHALLLLAGSELRPRAPPVLTAAAVQEEAAAAAVPKHPEAAAVLHGSAHRGELGRSLQHLGLPRRRSPNPPGRSAGGGAARSMRTLARSTERQHGGGGCEGRRRAGLRSARVEPPEVESACPLPPPSTVALDRRRCGSLHTDARTHARPAAARLAPRGCRPARSAGDEQGGPARR
ncbi:hypothetical protein PVAP13_6KG254806 [Panicum virgatum]|uniref:Uncharacterized protein n=1 Tax=Panicum virgatum TaxID=38727 RepID=A0A8T0RDJ5_PANVG|nr:hypothetical protein PVAP13_6KG254806 [Panicum virgatum]